MAQGDELGYVPFSKAGAELLFEVVSKAYEQTSLLVTTNLGVTLLDRPPSHFSNGASMPLKI